MGISERTVSTDRPAGRRPIPGLLVGFGAVLFTAGWLQGLWRFVANDAIPLHVVSVGAGIVAAGVVFDAGSSGEGWWRGFRFGAAAAGLVAAVASSLPDGPQLFTYAVLAVALVGSFGGWLVRGRRQLVTRWGESAVLGGAWSITAAAAVVAWVALVTLPSATLGHDESVYATWGRSWVLDLPATLVEQYRPPGLAAIGALATMVADSQVVLRLLGALMAVGTTLTVWMMGRRLLSPAAGMIGALVFAGAIPVLRRSGEFLNDLIATALILVVTWLIHDAFELRRPRYLLWATLPAAAAFYLRYGTILTLAGIALVAAVTWRDRLASYSRALFGAAGLAVAALAPHLLWSTAVAGGPLAVMLDAGEVAGPAYFGAGLVDYLTAPVQNFGILGLVFCIAAMAAIVADRPARYLLGCGVVALVITGVGAHAEPRYVFYTLAVGSIVGAHLLAATIGRRRTNGFVTVLLPLIVLALGTINAFAEREILVRMADANRVIVEAADRAAELGEAACEVVTAYAPTVEYYSECPTRTLPTVHSDQVDEPGEVLLWFENGKHQTDPTVLDGLVVVGEVVSAHDTPGTAFLYAGG